VTDKIEAGPTPISALSIPAWEAAKAAESLARAAMSQFSEQVVGAIIGAHDAGMATFDQVTEAEERRGDYEDVHDEALRDAISTPAPDMRAVADKLVMLIKDEEFYGVGNCDRDGVYEALLADILRLQETVQ
jgi:hypothetical protein